MRALRLIEQELRENQGNRFVTGAFDALLVLMWAGASRVNPCICHPSYAFFGQPPFRPPILRKMKDCSRSLRLRVALRSFDCLASLRCLTRFGRHSSARPSAILHFRRGILWSQRASRFGHRVASDASSRASHAWFAFARREGRRTWRGTFSQHDPRARYEAFESSTPGARGAPSSISSSLRPS